MVYIRAMDRKILLNDDQIVLESPYDATEVADVKQIAGAKWDRLGKVWRIPVSSLKQVKIYAVQHDYWLDPDLRVLDLPDHPFERQGIELNGESLIIRFSYDSVRVAAVRLIPGARWDTKKKIWVAPVSAVSEAIGFARNFKLHVPEELEEIQVEIQERQAVGIAASRATVSNIQIPDLKLSLIHI